MWKYSYHSYYCLVVIVLLTAIPQTTVGGESRLEVIYPPPKSELDSRDIDIIEILQTALQKTENSDGPFSLTASSLVMSSSRAHAELERGKLINVIFETVSEKFEQMFIPVRIPIRKGILGYRVFLIRKQDQPMFSAINSLDELKQLTLGQGEGWSDVKLFEANGFKVITGINYEGLFNMLTHGRFDFFSRGINEAYAEYESRKDKLPDLWVEEHLAIHYPFPKYFFVTKRMPHLAHRIEKGLNIMLKDGSYDRIFWKYHGETIKAIKFDQRKLFRLKNYLLPPTVPLEKEELWFDPYKK